MAPSPLYPGQGAIQSWLTADIAVPLGNMIPVRSKRST